MRFLRNLKRKLYFLVARYFAFFAGVYLKRWKPKIITVIGSSGKTTLLHLFEAQLGSSAKYSHHANSTFGIPFNILGLERKSFRIYEWFLFALLSPFKALWKVDDRKIYVTEADAERPGEGKFLAELLKPDIVLWLSLEEAHGINYDKLLPKGLEGEERINDLRIEMAREFGYFVEYAKEAVFLNSDNEYIKSQTERTKAKIIYVSENDIERFALKTDSIVIYSKMKTFSVPSLIPQKASLSVVSVVEVLKYLNLPTDPEFKNFRLPPGRSSVFKGIKNTTIIDSSYNATFDGVYAMLELFKSYPCYGEQWLVLGDMIEQGESEEFEHKKIAEYILNANLQRVILVGPRLRENTYEILKGKLGEDKVVSFMMPIDAWLYLREELKGVETILVKGARFLEGVVERLLENPEDKSKLCRREEIWVKKRKKWGI